MNKELAKTLTLALINYIDENRPEGTMDCSSGECVSLEKAFTEENFDSVEGFIQKKLSRLTEFEKALAELVNDVLTKEPQNPAVWIVGSGWTDKLFSLAREQFIKDGYVIEKKAFHDAVEKVDPEVMKEVSDEVDEMLEKEQKPAEWSEFDKGVLEDAICATDILAKDFKKDNPHLAKTLRVAKEWLEYLPERFSLPIKQEWDEFDEDCLKRAIWYIENPAPSVVKDTNLALWLKSLPGRFNLQPKQEWVEEDERDNFDILLSMIDASDSIPYIGGHLKLSDEMKSKLKTFIKSLCPQPHWKPSEEQMEALNALNLHGDLSYVGQQNQLISLYQDLKKL